ncbi:MAG: amidohydrolase [Actinomycetota bacterium]|nr:amidohydrolase [Actinomycetota bacterium]
MSILIQNATVIAVDEEHGTTPFPADIRVDGDRIDQIGPELPVGDASEVIDGRRRLAIPGLINSHFHSNQNFMRGRYPSRPLELMMLYAYPFDPSIAISPELVYLRTLAVAIEALKSGVTCVLDDCAELPGQDMGQLAALFGAYQESGIRANCSGHVINRPFADTLPYAERFLPDDLVELFHAAEPPTTEAYMDFAAEAVSRFHGHGRQRFVVAPSGPQRCTVDLLGAAAEFAKRHKTAYHTHVLETKVQLVTGRELYGKSLVQHLHDAGALNERLTMAHAIWITPEDIELMVASGCSVAHNPVCNLRIGSGIAPLRELLDAGINVALGTDEIDCNDSGRLFDVMHLAGLIHNLTDYDYDLWPTAAEVLYAATMGGARSLCLEDDVGSLTVGKKADIVLVDLDASPFVPLNDPCVHLVYSENGSSVTDVLVDGEVVVRDRKLTRIDEAAVLAEIADRAPEYLAQRDEWEAVAREYEPHMKALYMHCMEQDMGLDRLAAGAHGKRVGA